MIFKVDGEPYMILHAPNHPEGDERIKIIKVIAHADRLELEKNE